MEDLDWASAPGSAGTVGVPGGLPLLPPDFIGGMDYRDVPSDYRAHEYLDQLKASSSAREGCRHYVDGARHTDLPESCWIIDPNAHHFIDMHITINDIPDRVSVAMVRNVGKMEPVMINSSYWTN